MGGWSNCRHSITEQRWVFQPYLHDLQEYNKGLFATSEWSQSAVKSTQMGILHWCWNATNTCALWIYIKWAFTARAVAFWRTWSSKRHRCLLYSVFICMQPHGLWADWLWNFHQLFITALPIYSSGYVSHKDLQVVSLKKIKGRTGLWVHNRSRWCSQVDSWGSLLG